jgi:ElaB/YqjD/DUF883 family membrane-anchored ribosome-binding protein
MKRIKKIAILVLTGLIALSSANLTGCKEKEKDPLKDAQKNLKKASENVKDAAKDAAQSIEKSVKDITK